MKSMLLAATVLSLGVGSAYANENGGEAGGYVYPAYQFPAQSAPSVATAPSGQAVHAYVANSSHGTWLFPPNQNSDGTNGSPSSRRIAQGADACRPLSLRRPFSADLAGGTIVRGCDWKG